jgi:2-methylcitrate dehydratase PrpD
MTQSLASRLTARLRAPVTQADRTRAALHVLDWAGCAVAGRATPAGAALAAIAPGIGAGTAHGAGCPGLSPAAAAFLNGGLGNVLEMDDIHRTSILHPGPVVIPAALAAAEGAGAGAGAFLDAVVRGYEAVIRVGAAVGPGHYAMWHNTSTCGPFGAAAAAGDLLGLPDQAMIWALGNAGTQASGPWRCRHEAVMSKQLHTARAAQSGLMAAELAAHGFTGPEWMLEGTQGFFAAMAPGADPQAVMADPGAPWRMWDTSFKPWPACRHAHPTIDAALALHGIPPDAIAAVSVETYPDAITFCDRPAPASEHEAKFSLQHCAALVLMRGAPGLADFGPPAVAATAPLRARTTVAAADPWASAYPARYGAAVTVTLSDGATRRAEIPHALGDPDNPVDEDRLVAKARALMDLGGHPDPDRLIGAALGLAPGGALSDFAHALAAR